jgi:ubiquinol-cytochrome c reductase iron-sulfur subunit
VSDDQESRGGALLARVLFGWEALRLAAGQIAALFASRQRPGTAEEAAAVRDAETGSSREADRLIRNVRHLNWGTFLVTFFFAVSLAAGVSFMGIYWVADKVHWDAGNTLPLGISLGVFFGAFGAGLILHAQWLMRRSEAIELRESPASPPETREEADHAYAAGTADVQRRALLTGMGTGAAALLVAMVWSVLRSLASPPEPALSDTVWTRGQKLLRADGKPISVDTLQPGSTAVVFPPGQIGFEKAQTVLVRVPQRALELWPDRVDRAAHGYVAYSRVCTHAGCPVGMFEETTCLLMCPCHQSTFNVLDDGQPTGGPASRPLPQLRLYVADDGTLRAAGGFSQPPGPGYWGM